MKKATIVLAVLAIILVTTSCNSHKAWKQGDIDAAKKKCIESSLSYSGADTSAATIARVTASCGCIVDKTAEKYNTQEEADKDDKGGMEILKECSKLGK